MTDRTASALAPRKPDITCPSWCTLGEHAGRDPHQATIGIIEAPGFVAEMAVQQQVPISDRVTPPVEVALTLDTDHAGRPTGRHSLVIPLPSGADVVAFLAESDHEVDVFVPYGGVRDGQGRPVACDPPRRPLAWARKVLDDTATGHDTYGEAVAQVLELRAALEVALAAADRAEVADGLA